MLYDIVIYIHTSQSSYNIIYKTNDVQWQFIISLHKRSTTWDVVKKYSFTFWLCRLTFITPFVHTFPKIIYPYNSLIFAKLAHTLSLENNVVVLEFPFTLLSFIMTMIKQYYAYNNSQSCCLQTMLFLKLQKKK